MIPREGGGVEREKSGREEIFKFSPSTGQPFGTEAKIRARLGGMVTLGGWGEDFFFLLSFFPFQVFGEGKISLLI